MLIEETLVGPAVAEQLDAVHQALERFWTAVDRSSGPRPSSALRLAFATGLVEIASNVVKFAYPPSGAGGNFETRLRLYPDRLEAVLTDWGQPFVEPEKGGADELADLAEGGYGLPLARRTLDRVEYRRDDSGLNEWRLVKQL